MRIDLPGGPVGTVRPEGIAIRPGCVCAISRVIPSEVEESSHEVTVPGYSGANILRLAPLTQDDISAAT